MVKCTKMSRSAEPPPFELRFEIIEDFENTALWATASVSRVEDKDLKKEDKERMETLVLAFVNSHPGCSSGEITEGVTGRAKDIRAARYALERRGQIRLQKAGRKHTFYPKEQDTDQILGDETSSDVDPAGWDHSE
jgi:hypothetical protein